MASPDLTLSQADFDCNHLGANAVTLVTGENGNKAATAITVEDNARRSFGFCEWVTVYLDETGSGTLSVASLRITATVRWRL